ncbi:MAG: hypothetical protein ABIN37_13515 [Burkholderiaceae bacterium]
MPAGGGQIGQIGEHTPGTEPAEAERAEGIDQHPAQQIGRTGEGTCALKGLVAGRLGMQVGGQARDDLCVPTV